MKERKKLVKISLIMMVMIFTAIAVVTTKGPRTESIIYSKNSDITSTISKIDMRSSDFTTNQITKPGSNDWFFSWPDKKDIIIFCSKRGGNFDVFSINIDGTNLRNLTKSPEDEHTPAISPDGKLIVYSTHKHNVQSIYRMNRDGSGKVRITKNYDYMAAKFSPDGKTILLIRRFYKSPSRIEFYLSDTNGKKMRKMDPLRMGHEDPVFSKDGKTILFSAVDPRLLSWQIFKIGSDGRNFKRLTSIKNGNFFAPIFSPDESEILFARRQSLEEKASLWLMNSDGSDQKQITDDDIKVTDGGFIDMNRIVACIKRGYNNWQIVIFSRDGKILKELTKDSGYNNITPRVFSSYHPR